MADYGLSRDSRPKGNRNNNNNSYNGMSRGSKPSGGNNNYNRSNTPSNNRQGGYGGYGGGYSNGSAKNNNLGDAHAPYNFVKLNDKVIEPPIAAKLSKDDLSGSYADYIVEKGKFSGYFEVEVTNLTPLYIGGANGFFSDGKNICIPGSSMRGCIKNIFKIITASAFRCDDDNPDVKDKHLYFRAFASKCKAFRTLYSDRMMGQEIVNGKTIGRSNAKAGFIIKQNNTYYVCPSNYKCIEGYGDDKVIWKDNCVEVYSGKIQKKRHFYRIDKPNWNKLINIPEGVINDYKDDTNRKAKLNVLEYKGNINRSSSIFKGAEKYSYICPCFYVLDKNGEVAHFGSNPYYRIPYIKSIGDHIPAALKNKDVVDFTDAVFGRKEDWASRVFFEDLYLEKKPVMEKPAYHKVLSSPNPTSFQFYIEKNEKTNEPNTWESNANIRGYKLYWHTAMKWQDDTIKDDTKLVKRISPLEESQTFKGRIRFDNLDAEELGALCSIFKLAENKNTCFKLGMGKSIGMGTIKVDAKLKLKQENYYDSLFDGDCFAASVESVNLDTYKTVFDKYVRSFLGEKFMPQYILRMNELAMILSIENMKKPDWNKIVDKMDFLNRNSPDQQIANERKPLPSITEVFNKVKH